MPPTPKMAPRCVMGLRLRQRSVLLVVMAALPACFSSGERRAPVGLECMGASAPLLPLRDAEAVEARNEAWGAGECAYFVEAAEDALSVPPATAQGGDTERALDGRAVSPRLLYLNANGGVYSPAAANHSGNDRSTLLAVDVDIPPFSGDAQAWSDLEACVERRFSRFGLMLTTRDPGDTPHIEAVIGGHPCQLALPDRVRGVSPLADDCTVLERAVVFVFAETIASPQVLCDVTVHEVGHALGLEHAYLCDDVMSYLRCGQRSFQDEDARCGARSPTECVCQERQNSAAHLYETLGAQSDADVERPVLTWREADFAQEAGPAEIFEVEVWVKDDGEIESVKLFVEGAASRLYECATTTENKVCTQPKPGTYRFRIPLASGDETVRAQAVDVSGNKGLSSVRALPFFTSSLPPEK